MSTIISRKLVSVFVIPEHEGYRNVVRRVVWAIRFERDGVFSDAHVETFLNVDALEDFIEASQVGNERVLQWAFDQQGGDAFVAGLQSTHERYLDYAKSKAGQVPYTEGFDLTVQTRGVQVPATTT